MILEINETTNTKTLKYLIIIFLLIGQNLHSQALKISRKGEHIGISVEGGVSGTAGHIDSIDITPNIAFSINIDIPMYITHFQGIWLRMSYSSLSADTGQSKIKIHTMGMSLKYLWNPPTNSGFFMITGPTLYFPIVSSIKNKQTDIITEYISGGEFLFGLGASLGINIIKNTDLALNTGVSFEAIIPEMPRPTIFTIRVFLGFTHRLTHKNHKNYYTK